jgi:hypothetical protein
VAKLSEKGQIDQTIFNQKHQKGSEGDCAKCNFISYNEYENKIPLSKNLTHMKIVKKKYDARIDEKTRRENENWLLHQERIQRENELGLNEIDVISHLGFWGKRSYIIYQPHYYKSYVDRGKRGAAKERSKSIPQQNKAISQFLQVNGA